MSETPEGVDPPDLPTGFGPGPDDTHVPGPFPRPGNGHGHDDDLDLDDDDLDEDDDPDRTHMPAEADGFAPARPVARPRYLPCRFLARGGLGKVSVVRDSDLQREVALKEILPEWVHDARMRARFIREAQVTGQLEHPNIVPVYELSRRPHDGLPFYTMRLVRGRTLADAVHKFHESARAGNATAPLARLRLLQAFVSVCRAIDYAHSRGVVHRDLKPENVAIGEFGEVQVLDWGLARVLDDPAPDAESDAPRKLEVSPEARLDHTVGRSGSPAYMAPEQVEGRVDQIGPWTDVYGLGTILYSVLTGRPPHHAESLEEALRSVLENPTPRARAADPAVSRALDAVCAKAMAAAPSDRYPSAGALADDLDCWLAGEPVSAWREPFWLRACRWMNRHRTLVTSTAAALMVAVLAGVASLATARSEGLAAVERLRVAKIEEVPAVLEDLGGRRFWAESRLREGLSRAAETSDEKLRMALGLLKRDPSQVDFLYRRMLAADAATVQVLRTELDRAHRAAVSARLWDDWPRLDPNARLRAAAALAHYTPDDPRWQHYSDWVVDRLLAEVARNQEVGAEWSKQLTPVMSWLVPSLVAVYNDPRPERSSASRDDALGLLKTHARRPEDVVPIIVSAPSEVFESFFPVLRGSYERAAGLLTRILEEGPRGDDRSDRARAQAAVALARLDRAAEVWRWLRSAPDPSVRSWLIDRLGPLGADPEGLIGRIQAETDPSERRALILALGGDFGPRLPDARRHALAAELAGRYREDPDCGVHSAIDWLLRSWGMDAPLRAIDREFAGKPPGKRGWYVSRLGDTFAVVRPAGPFRMGTDDPPNTALHEAPKHLRHIPRSYLIATREVTVRDFVRILPEPGRDEMIARLYSHSFSPEVDCPINGQSWAFAAIYARWYGSQDGVPESQQCYPDKSVLQDALETKSLPLSPDEVLDRSGYRLPTETEWEYACRAGTETERFFGSGEELLPRYAWYSGNSPGRSYPVGRLLPNDQGLFDLYGNVREWCHEGLGDYMTTPLPLPDYPSKNLKEIDAAFRPLRGGSALDPALLSRSGDRQAYQFDGRQVSCGLRPTRTLPEAPAGPSRNRNRDRGRNPNAPDGRKPPLSPSVSSRNLLRTL
ncbi:MAG: bifunctional serine/threonine-protein kinase/formylglycine-generating enzyme family protein [Isosphaeraceae bacterium]